MKRSKVIATTLVAFILSLNIMIPASASQYVSISELRGEVQNGWHQTYQAHGRTIEVDVDIHVPDVSKVPVVKAGVYSFSDFQPPADVIDYYIEEGRESGFLLSYWNIPYLDTYDKKEFARSLVMEGTQAENNPMTAEEAENFALTVLQGVEKEPLEYECYAIIPYSKWYIDDAGVDGDLSGLNKDKPVTLMGEYRVEFHQMIKGIPVIESGEAIGGAHGNGRAMANINVNVFSTENYGIKYYPIREKNVVVDDTPLLPFNQIKNKFEEYISKGVIRDIYRVEFGYMLFDDTDTQEYILKPIWAMRSAIMWNPKKPTLIYDPVLLGENRLTGGPIGVFVDAQTGEAYTQFEIPKNRKSLPTGKILTWDDVK